ncbi:MAG TPA: RNA 2',3'-cyclic phosphodiesterase [Candidatus Bathyarchaeia archaeon]|nr:RNA 2',3'-cyclic phosphodiesterase [Candidatus Bathyarchaeia archaeon]
MSEMIRCFIAFDINNPSVLTKFTEVQDLLAKTGADLKLVEPQNVHITVRFLGDIHGDMVDQVHEGMKQITFSAFDCDIHGLGAFPNMHHARVVWAGMGKGSDELRSVTSQLESKLRSLGFRPDPKGFSPHLTLARVKTGRNKNELARSVQELTDFDFGVVRADCLKLKKSVLTPRGPIYSTLRDVCH